MLVIVYQIAMFAVLFNEKRNDPYYWPLTVKSWVFYSIVPFQLGGTLLLAVIVQLIVCMCF